MSFQWKSHTDIFKGEGIYFLTWAVVNRSPILGTLEPLSVPDADGHIAWVKATELGKAVLWKLKEMEERCPQLQVLGKVLMPDHLHAVVWMQAGFDGSIKMVARGFAQGCSQLARRVAKKEVLLDAQSNCANYIDTTVGIANYVDTAIGTNDPYDCGNGAHTLFSTPFIRTLSHKGQLNRMIQYMKANPDNAWMRRQHPDLYTIHRNMEYGDLHFDTMGKSRLLDYPDKQVIALPRSLTDDEIAYEVRKALAKAETGVVTLTAAINEGEKAVSKAIREAGYPLAVMMLDGFPKEGTEAARYFHPSGVYHKACGEGRLYLMAPLPENYDNPMLIEQTEQALARKAAAKGQRYHGIPHDSKRWRMIAGNVMLEMIL